MEVEFRDKDYDRLETDPGFNAGFSKAVVVAFRKRMQLIRAAPDERTFYALKSLHFEKLEGDRSHQRSMRLNKQWRLILELKEGGKGSVVGCQKADLVMEFGIFGKAYFCSTV